MDQITPEQLFALSQQFTDMANAIVDFRSGHTGISEEQDSQLAQLSDSLFDNSSALATLSAIASGSEAATAIDSLNQVNDRIAKTIRGLQDVQKVIDIATAAVKVVISVISLKPGDIIDSVGGLASASGIAI